MKWIICFSMALALVIAAVIYYFVSRSRGKGNIKYLGAGAFLASVVICFPVMRQVEGAGLAFGMSLSHSIRMFVVDTGIIDIIGELPAEEMGWMLMPYKILVCGLYLLAPIFTLTVVLQYFSNIFERMRLALKRKRNLFVFSELNTHSLEVASYMKKYAKGKKEKIEILFCCSSKKDHVNVELEQSAREIGAVLLPEEIVHVKLRNQNRFITYFLISDNEDENVEYTLQMIDNFTGGNPLYQTINQRNIELHCYATSAEAEILIDSKEKQDIRVILTDEVRDAIYEHLYQYPLYTNMKRKEITEGMEKEKITLLIAGAGKTGSEFLKAAVWCGQMNQFEIEIHLIDERGNQIREELEQEYPELFAAGSGYQISIHQGNIFSSKTQKYLETLKEVNYCVAALGNDEDAIRAAIWMRRYFYIANQEKEPFICAHIRSKRKRDAVWELHEVTRSKTMQYYEIVPFGKEGMYYGSSSESAFITEYLGLGVQSHYFRLTEQSGEEERRYAIGNFYAKQFNRRSSIANGMHISSKLWEMGYGILKMPTNEQERKVFDACVSPVNFYEETKEKRKVFYALEHERWMAYMRTEGWRLTSRSDCSLKAIQACYEGYMEVFKNQNYMMKMHPALVPLESDCPEAATLQEVDDMIVKANEERGVGSYYPDYVQSDVELIDHIGEIVGGKWCGEKGVPIFGTVAKENICVICKLEDLLTYYSKIYEERKDNLTAEERMVLREQIRRCRNE